MPSAAELITFLHGQNSPRRALNETHHRSTEESGEMSAWVCPQRSTFHLQGQGLRAAAGRGSLHPTSILALNEAISCSFTSTAASRQLLWSRAIRRTRMYYSWRVSTVTDGRTLIGGNSDRIVWTLLACDIMLNMLKVHTQQKIHMQASDLEVFFY